jgi:superfamily II DNA or RNA helicase
MSEEFIMQIKELGGSDRLVDAMQSLCDRGGLPHQSLEDYFNSADEALGYYFDIDVFDGILLNELEELTQTVKKRYAGNSQKTTKLFSAEKKDAVNGSVDNRSPEGLRKLDIAVEYRSDSSNIAKDFIQPCVHNSVRYRRAVGYFTSAALALLSQGLKEFAASNGRMQLVASPVLEIEDIEAVERGLRSRNDVIEASLIKALVDAAEEPDGLALLAWLVAEELLEIRIAVPSKASRGIFHEKIGIFTDQYGSSVAFTGSPNETYGGLVNNFESLDVYWSWDDPHQRVNLKIRNFDRLWSNQTEGIEVLLLPDAVKRKIVEAKVEAIAEETPEYQENVIKAAIPKTLNGLPYKLFDHQLEALREWKAHDYQGIFRLATGAGKTLTAIHGAVTIANQSVKKLVVVVAVPYQILADQWCDVLKYFNLNAIRCYKSKAKWQTQLRSNLLNLKLLPDENVVAVVVVNRTLQSTEFQECLSLVDRNILFFIGDECHHHATEKLLDALPDARFKIGLSATPWSRREDERRALLQSFYGGIVANYSIEDAIEQKVLSPYVYHPHVVHLTEGEMDRYDELSARISKLIAIRESGGSYPELELKTKLMARQRIIGSANEKFEELENLLERSPITNHTLFYCGDGSVETDEVEQPQRDVERASLILRDRGWKTSRFTAEQSYSQREMILHSFVEKHINAMVAIRVLDEGFDVPSCSKAFLLASSTNERQFIQRRGRILRQFPGKSNAVIHDFIVLPDRSYTGPYASSLVRNELYRLYEFARISINKDECFAIADDLAQQNQVDMAEIEQALMEADANEY